MMISYSVNAALDLDAVIDLYIASTLGERRPVDDRACMAQMLAEANLTITAWDGELLVGIARALTDWCYCCYLSDLAVRASHQGLGIGKQLIQRTSAELGSRATLVLLAAPAAVDFYPHIGLEEHPSAWVLRPGDRLND
jgi:GNAT superfamily N-acetyltransferase